MGAVRSPLSANEAKRMRGDTRGGRSMERADKDGQKKKKKKKGNANQLESLFALTPVSLFPLITCSLRVIRAGCTTTTVVALYSQPGGPPVGGFIRQKSYILTVTGIKNQYYRICASASLSPFFTQSQLLSPKAHILLLVAIAFSSTILPSPNPHTDLLGALVINYPQVKRLKRAGPKPDRATLMNHTS